MRKGKAYERMNMKRRQRGRDGKAQSTGKSVRGGYRPGAFSCGLSLL